MVFKLDEEEKEDSFYFHRFEPALSLAEVVAGAESDVSREQLADAIGDIQNVEMGKARLAFHRFAVVKQHDPSMWRRTEHREPDLERTPETMMGSRNIVVWQNGT